MLETLKKEDLGECGDVYFCASVDIYFVSLHGGYIAWNIVCFLLYTDFSIFTVVLVVVVTATKVKPSGSQYV